MKKNILFLSSILLMFGACLNEKGPIPKKSVSTCDSTIHYMSGPVGSLTVDSILRLNCLGCHSSGSSPRIELENVPGTTAGYDNMKLIADDGRLAKYVLDYTDKPMPQNAPLTAVEIKVIDCWIKQGAQNN